MGLLKFLLITILVLYLVRLAVRLLLPMLFGHLVNKAQQQAGQYRHRQEPGRSQGTLHVDYVPPKDKEARAADKAGDFIDFEEIK
jgi:hypothetical protein